MQQYHSAVSFYNNYFIQPKPVWIAPATYEYAFSKKLYHGSLVPRPCEKWKSGLASMHCCKLPPWFYGVSCTLVYIALITSVYRVCLNSFIYKTTNMADGNGEELNRVLTFAYVSLPYVVLCLPYWWNKRNYARGDAYSTRGLLAFPVCLQAFL